MRLKYSLVAVVLSLASACDDAAAASRSFPVTFNALLPEGTPLAGARFWAQGRELGVSDEHGKLRASLTGREGESAAVGVICPPGYRGPSQPRSLPLRAFAPANPRDGAALELSMQCDPEQRLVALAVRSLLADKPVSVPVQVDGAQVGSTDEHGTGHFLLRVAPNASLRVTLDTTSLSNTLPQNPVRSFDIEESESILLFDQRFEVAKKKTAAPHAHARKPQLPYRIE